MNTNTRFWISDKGCKYFLAWVYPIPYLEHTYTTKVFTVDVKFYLILNSFLYFIWKSYSRSTVYQVQREQGNIYFKLANVSWKPSWESIFLNIHEILPNAWVKCLWFHLGSEQREDLFHRLLANQFLMSGYWPKAVHKKLGEGQMEIEWILK